MRKIDILNEVYSEKQRRWACWQTDAPKSQRKLSKNKAWEMCKDVEHSKKNEETINPKMKKGDLIEYVYKNKTRLNENFDFDLPVIHYGNHTEKKFLLNYIENIRKSGMINMLMAYYMPGSEVAPSQILVWDKDEFYRFLFGKKLDPDYLKKSMSNDDYEDYEDDDDDDDDEDRDYEQENELLNVIEYLLNNKNKIRDTLINITIRQLSNDDDFDFDNMKLFNRKFSDMANSAIKMYMMTKGYR